MKKILLFSLTIITGMLLSSQTAFCSTEQNNLWKKAVKTTGNNVYWVPGKIETKENTYDTKGTLQSTEKLTFAVHQAKKNIYLTKAVFSNYVLTKKEIKEFNQKTGNTHIEELLHPGLNPFNVLYQDNIKVQPCTQEITQEGKTYQKFLYSMTTEDSTWKGEAWIEKTSGIPLKITASPSDLKLEEEKNIEIKKFTMTVYFKKINSTLCHIHNIYTEALFTYSQSPWFSFEGISKETTVFSDFFKLTPLEKNN